ncbi:MAG: homoserine dehydrogenase [Ruminococcaceae bacterium]|nr:homoserine dehydrogenase [Oscillospiraceae bacterium]
MVNVAILGFGVVGSGVYEVITKNNEIIKQRAGKKINVKYILDIRDFSNHEAANLFVKDFDTILNDDSVEIIAEVIGGATFAYECTKKALLKGKNVVTSNKELVAKYGHELLQIAKENNVKYYFEASVGGGIPIIRPLKTCLSANQICEICGILNGTTNYILSQMINNDKTLEEALKEAQEKGYAERDPSADIEGHDASRKICILSSLAYGKRVDSDKIYTEGITKLSLEDVKLASKFGYVIKLLGHCKKVGDMLDVEVSPALVPKHHPLAPVEDVFNAILVNGDAVDDTMFYGRGAGKLPTASAVVADVIDIAKSDGFDPSLMWTDEGSDKIIDHLDSKKKFFIRLEGVKDVQTIKSNFDAVDVLNEKNECVFITGIMSEKDINDKLTALNSKIVSKIKVI